MFEVTRPPKNVTVVVVKAPAVVTSCSVGVAPELPGQFVPFWRQTFWPPTVRSEPMARFEPVAFWKLKVVIVPEVERKFVMVPVVADKVVAMMFVAPRFIAKRFVVVTDVPVADVKVRPWRDVLPPTVNPPVRFMFDPVAPLNWKYVAKRFVDVVFVPVAFTHVMFVGLKFGTDKFVKVAFVAVRLV